MSNKLKKKGFIPKGVPVNIPSSAQNKSYDSLSALGAALGVKPTEQPPKAKNCRKCGHPMRQVYGTNVWVCDGEVEMVPCNNRAITGVGPRPQSSENPGNSKPKYQGKSAVAAV